MDIEKELNNILKDPLFDDIKAAEKKQTSEDRMVQSFEEINTFFETNHRLPSNKNGIKEKLLCSRLQGFLSDDEKLKYLLPYDRLELLRPKQPVTETDIDALLNNSILDVQDSDGILSVPEHLRKSPQIDDTDYIAQRRKCEDFYLYKDGFTLVHKELKEGKRSYTKFSSNQLEHPGSYFILDGMLLLLAKVIAQNRDNKGRLTGRSICIFENGTMTDVKLDTLRRALYENGYTIRENNETTSEYIEKQFNVNQNDKPTGYIYVLKSLSENPEIKSIENLYKIGFSTTSVEERIANAENESTYLNAKVQIVATWQTMNMNIAKFESLIHHLFKDVRLQIKVGNHIPEEWFIVPYPVIEKAIQCISKAIPISYDTGSQIIIEETAIVSDKKQIIDTTGLKILSLNIKEAYFLQIIDGSIKKIPRKLKQSTTNKYTYFEEGKRWLKKFDAILFCVGYHKDRQCALVKVTNAKFDMEAQTVIYSLGEIISKE